MMDILTDIFARVCGQGHCFEVGGEALPVCGRCMGVYFGGTATGVWLMATGLWRRGLPSWGVFLVNVVVLLAALAGGLHVIEGGTTWRVLCGLWTGHVVMLWLAGGSQHLVLLARGSAQKPWRLGDKVQALAAIGVLAGLAAAITQTGLLKWLGWSVSAAIIALGAVLLLAGLVAAIVALVLLAARHGDRKAAKPQAA